MTDPRDPEQPSREPAGHDPEGRGSWEQVRGLAPGLGSVPIPPLPFLLGASIRPARGSEPRLPPASLRRRDFHPPPPFLPSLTSAAPPPAGLAAPGPTEPTPFEDFHTQLRQALRRAPWLLVSIAFHVLLFAVLANMVWLRTPDERLRSLMSDAKPSISDGLLETSEVEDEPFDETEILEEDPEVNEDDLVVDAPDDVAELEQAIPLPLDHRGLNEIVGMAGSEGRAFSGKYRRRGQGGSGSSGTERAVKAGLDWLHRHQRADGSWDADGFHGECLGGPCPHPGAAQNDVGVTGLALLAFLGSGSTFEQGVYRHNIRDGLRWLQDLQHPRDGCFGPRESHSFLYGHALATLAMVEAYHLSRQPLLKRPAQRGLDFIARARNPYAAWRYAYPANGDNDVSVSGWMLFALFAGKDAGLDTDPVAIRRGMAYLEFMTDPQTSRTGYSTRGAGSNSMTAVALLLRIFHGETRGESPVVRGSADALIGSTPRWGQKDFYYWYYASYAMWQLGGTYWHRWQSSMLDAIVDHQVKGRGCDRGSWDPLGDPWAGHGGRVYSTSLATLCLQVYYRYDRVKGSR